MYTQYLLALVEEQKDIPIVNVLDKAVPPLLRTKPKRTFMVMISVIVAGLIGIILAYSVEFYKKVRVECRTNEKFQSYFDMLIKDFIRIKRVIKKE